MKTACFLFVAVGLGALTPGFSFADEPSRQPSGQESGENQTDIRHSPSNADSPAPETIRRTVSTQSPPQRPAVDHLSRTASTLNKTVPTVNEGLPVNKPAGNSVQLVRPPMGGGTTVLSPGIVRKSAGPTASLGGLAASSLKTSTSGINGTGMKRTLPR